MDEIEASGPKNLLIGMIVFVVSLVTIRLDHAFHNLMLGTSLIFISSASCFLLYQNFKSKTNLLLIFIGSLLAELISGVSFNYSLTNSVGLIIEILLANLLFDYITLNQKLKFHNYFRLTLLIVLAFLSPIPKSIFWGLYEHKTHNPLEPNLFPVLNNFYLSDVIGYLVILPLVFKIYTKKISLVNILIVPLIFFCIYFLGRYDLPQFSILFLILSIYPLLNNNNGTTAVINLSVVMGLSYLVYKSQGAYSFIPKNSEINANQLLILTFYLTYHSVEQMGKSKYFHTAKKLIISLWIFLITIYLLRYKQERRVVFEGINDLNYTYSNLYNDKINGFYTHLSSISNFLKAQEKFSKEQWERFNNQAKSTFLNSEIEVFGLILNDENKSIFNSDTDINLLSKILSKEDFTNFFKENILTKDPIFFNDPRISSKYDNLGLTLFYSPIIENQKVIAWSFCIINNQKMFTKIADFFNHYKIEVRNQNLHEDINHIVDFKDTISMANKRFNIYWTKDVKFRSNYIIFSPLTALVLSIISSFLTFIYINFKKQSEESEIENNNLKNIAQNNERRYQTIFSKSSEGILIFNHDYLIEANEKFYNLFSLSRQKLKAVIFEDLFFHEQAGKINKLYFIKSKMYEIKAFNSISFEAICTRKEQSFLAEINLSQFEENNSVFFVAHFIDITDRKKIESNLIQSREFAIEASKAKSRFLSNMSHEIRTPLNGILGLIQLMLEETKDLSSKNIDNLKIMEYSTNHLLHILNEILDYSKIEVDKLTLEIRDINFKNLVHNIAYIYQDLCRRKNLKFHLDYDPSIPEFLKLDEHRNTQILNNFLSNSLKFTESGTITLKVRLIKNINNYATVFFEIHDSGIGIPSDKIEYIFTEFAQAAEDHTRKYGGTGLGLPISKKLIELQDGKINVKSEVNSGTTIDYSIAFRIADNTTNQKDTETPVYNEKKLENKKVLLVEDNEVNIVVAEKFLEKWKMQIDIAKNGLEAVELVTKNNYDVILMDFHMPVMDGITATKKIREFNKLIPIIGLSADISKDNLNNYRDYQMTGFLSKPFKSKELLKIFADILK